MANRRERHEDYGARDEFEDRRHRGRQQGSDYGGSGYHEAGGSGGRRQQHGERSAGEYPQGDPYYGAGQVGWQRDDDFGARQGGFGGEQPGRGSGRYQDRFGFGGRDEGSETYRPDRDYRSRSGDYGEWRSRSHYGDRSGRGYAGGQSYGSGAEQGERGFWDKASDEVSSWLGDEDAERRRQMDQHRGRGPRNYTRSDDRIREDVNDRLTDDGFIDASDIDVMVENREVTLSGEVASREEKRRAEDIAEAISGVTHVQNNLRVRRGGATGSSFGGTDDTGTAAGAAGRRSGL